MTLGSYPLRLPSYRSAHGRRYHPYPAVRRHANNDESYMDFIPDFDYEAAEHVLEVPPASLQLHPVRRDDDDADVMAFQLDASAAKHTKDEDADAESKVAILVVHRKDDEGEQKPVTAKPLMRLTALYTLFLCLHYVQGRLTKSRINTQK
ncbi:uncharacterized protein C8Q71DRAFT_464267 [Rhodofomes roseus]|uniref:Uncharacterized protein n=1 Tax=Rhodofomes roseus TaxID=34475 RepID=A0ABQ8KNU6_9APHY|nr:uncharacterized protein C8Q71DRAFT_464267 [Rhodofomes roseus]KAH9839833.1 hypothetical protein C8Q71DRAFT_464267 [Rhodofomes roseus]